MKRVVPCVLFLLVVALVVFRGSGGRQRPEAPVYVINDAVEFAAGSLDPEVMGRLGKPSWALVDLATLTAEQQYL